MMPTNPLSVVRELAANEEKCEFFSAVIEELTRRGMDTDELREIIRVELAEKHCFYTAETRKHKLKTTSDYYSFWVDVCAEHMFIKLLVVNLGQTTQRLVVTSFKKDRNNE